MTSPEFLSQASEVRKLGMNQPDYMSYQEDNFDDVLGSNSFFFMTVPEDYNPTKMSAETIYWHDKYKSLRVQREEFDHDDLRARRIDRLQESVDKIEERIGVFGTSYYKKLYELDRQLQGEQ